MDRAVLIENGIAEPDLPNSEQNVIKYIDKVSIVWLGQLVGHQLGVTQLRPSLWKKQV